MLAFASGCSPRTRVCTDSISFSMKLAAGALPLVASLTCGLALIALVDHLHQRTRPSFLAIVASVAALILPALFAAKSSESLPVGWAFIACAVPLALHGLLDQRGRSRGRLSDWADTAVGVLVGVFVLVLLVGSLATSLIVGDAGRTCVRVDPSAGAQ